MTFWRRRSVKPLPKAAFTPDADSDLKRLMAFIAKQPWGKPADRRREIHSAVRAIKRAPLARPVCKRLKDTNIELRRYFAGQFAIVYSYFDPTAELPAGLVSIRGIRHHRERDTLFRVRESGALELWNPLQTRDTPVEGVASPVSGSDHQT